MFVFVCCAYIKVPICVLAGGFMERTGEVCWGALGSVVLLSVYDVAHVKAKSSKWRFKPGKTQMYTALLMKP